MTFLITVIFREVLFTVWIGSEKLKFASKVLTEIHKTDSKIDYLAIYLNKCNNRPPF